MDIINSIRQENQLSTIDPNDPNTVVNEQKIEQVLRGIKRSQEKINPNQLQITGQQGNILTQNQQQQKQLQKYLQLLLQLRQLILEGSTEIQSTPPTFKELIEIGQRIGSNILDKLVRKPEFASKNASVVSINQTVQQRQKKQQQQSRTQRIIPPTKTPTQFEEERQEKKQKRKAEIKDKEDEFEEDEDEDQGGEEDKEEKSKKKHKGTSEKKQNRRGGEGGPDFDENFDEVLDPQNIFDKRPREPFQQLGKQVEDIFGNIEGLGGQEPDPQDIFEKTPTAPRAIIGKKIEEAIEGTADKLQKEFEKFDDISIGQEKTESRKKAEERAKQRRQGKSLEQIRKEIREDPNREIVRKEDVPNDEFEEGVQTIKESINRGAEKVKQSLRDFLTNF